MSAGNNGGEFQTKLTNEKGSCEGFLSGFKSKKKRLETKKKIPARTQSCIKWIIPREKGKEKPQAPCMKH